MVRETCSLENAYSLTGYSVTAVASGGVLRGLKKEPGSLRKAQLSYGLLNIEPFKPDQPGHKLGTAITDHREGAEGAKYIHVINYFIVQVSRLIQKASGQGAVKLTAKRARM
jgi:hypothetical protein